MNVADEPLSYGTCFTLEEARNTADSARRERLLGKYPAACVVLDMQVARLNFLVSTLQADARRYRYIRSNCECMGERPDDAIDAALFQLTEGQ